MVFWTQNFTRTHGIVFLPAWGIFAVLTFTAMAMNVPHGPDGYGQVILATIGILAGPMPGALSRAASLAACVFLSASFLTPDLASQAVASCA